MTQSNDDLRKAIDKREAAHMSKFQTFTTYLAVFVAGGLLVAAYDHMVYRIKERAAIAVVDSTAKSVKSVVDLVKRKCE